MIRLVCFDLDGVLVDACEWHYESLNRALQDTCGFSLTREEHELTYNALPTRQKLAQLSKEGRVSPELHEKIFNLKQDYTKICIAESAKNDEVKIEMMRYLWEKQIMVTCVTNSITETAKFMLLQTGQLQYVHRLIASDMVMRPKPHPEGYLTAIAAAGVTPEETLVVEDSPKGLEAAYASGANVMRVDGCADVTLANIKPYLEQK